MRVIKTIAAIVTLPVVGALSIIQLMIDLIVKISSVIAAPFITICIGLLVFCLFKREIGNTLIMAGIIAAVVLLYTSASAVYALIESVKRGIRYMTS